MDIQLLVIFVFLAGAVYYLIRRFSGSQKPGCEKCGDKITSDPPKK